MRIRGSLDVVTVDHATGWLFSPDNPADITVVAMINREIIGEAIADILREDLAAVGFGDGHCGFRIEFYKQIDPAYLPFITVHPEGCDLHLPRYAPTGFAEFFTSLYLAHPNAGRNRSVYGGLWTDRTDARAILKGRVSIVQLDASTAISLEQLILDGVTLLPAGALAMPNASADQFLSAALTPDISRVLEAAFDDHPVSLGTDVLTASLPLAQASAETRSPSPAECLLLLAPLGDAPVMLDIIRASHTLPEFTAEGSSRWIAGATPLSENMALLQTAMVERVDIMPGMVALVGAGTIYALHIEDGDVLRARLVPSRSVPLGTILINRSKQTEALKPTRGRK
jgi:hypothetical protein